MSKQIVKSSAMLVLLIGLAFVVTAIPANGQSPMVAADVPFNFIVGNKNLAAGKYRVDELTSIGEVLRINSRDLKSSAVTMSITIERERGNNTAKLVFHRYGNTYFLTEIWGADSYGRQLPKSSRERSLERELASIPSKSDLTMNSFERVEVLACVR